jgi:hypothetical protein
VGVKLTDDAAAFAAPLAAGPGLVELEAAFRQTNEYKYQLSIFAIGPRQP